MKYVVLIYSNPATWSALPPEVADGVLQDHFKMIRELNESGEMVSQFGLADASNTKTMRIDNRIPVITDGPFGEAKEQLAGVFVVDVEGLDRALEISRPLAQYSVVEVRPLMEDAGTEM